MTTPTIPTSDSLPFVQCSVPDRPTVDALGAPGVPGSQCADDTRTILWQGDLATCPQRLGARHAAGVLVSLFEPHEHELLRIFDWLECDRVIGRVRQAQPAAVYTRQQENYPARFAERAP